MKKNEIVPQLDKLEKALGGDLDLVTFFVSWLKNGRNATKAYKELNPHVTDHSARILGSRQLAKVDKREIMRAYGLDEDLYYKQLVDGTLAEKVDPTTGEKLPDHKTREPYHKRLGTILGIENQPANLTQVNIGEMTLTIE